MNRDIDTLIAKCRNLLSEQVARLTPLDSEQIQLIWHALPAIISHAEAETKRADYLKGQVITHERIISTGVYVKTADYAAECAERRDLRVKLSAAKAALEKLKKDNEIQFSPSSVLEGIDRALTQLQ